MTDYTVYPNERAALKRHPDATSDDLASVYTGDDDCLGYVFVPNGVSDSFVEELEQREGCNLYVVGAD